MDLLDPRLPSARALKMQLREARLRRIKIGLGVGGGVLAGILIGAGAITIASWLRARPQPVPEINVSFAVASEPPGAAVLVDGKPTGLITPTSLREWDFSVPHELSFQLADYYTERREVAAGLHPPDLHVPLARLSHLSVRSEPAASIYLENTKLGITPGVFDMPADREVEVSVRLAGYLPVTERLRLGAGEQAERNIMLHAIARLSVNSVPLGARVTIDGQKSVLTPADVDLASGMPHTLEASVPGLPAQTRTVRLKDGQLLDLTFRFEDPQDRAARAELERIRAREAVAEKKLEAVRNKGSSSEFFSTVNRLHNEDQLSDEIDRLEKREQEISDELAAHELELEDRIKGANMGAKHE
jgi:hypothetical protein